MNVLLVLLAAAGGVMDRGEPRQLRIEVRVCKGDPLGSTADGTVKSLAEPALCCLNRRAASFLAGTAGKGQEKPCGIQLDFCPTILADGSIRLAMTTAVSTPQEIVVKFGDGKRAVTAVNTHTTRHERVVKPGEPFRVRIAADSVEVQTWAEVTVREQPRSK